MKRIETHAVPTHCDLDQITVGTSHYQRAWVIRMPLEVTDWCRGMKVAYYGIASRFVNLTTEVNFEQNYKVPCNKQLLDRRRCYSPEIPGWERI